jgi:hypothetical protein
VKLALALTGLVLLAGSARAQTAGTTRIELVWTEVADRVSPEPMSNIKTEFFTTLVLNPGGQVQEISTAVSGRYTRSGDRSAALGQGWRVGQNNSITRSIEYPHHARELTITVNGSECTLQVVQRLKPGYSDYWLPRLARSGQIGTYRRVETVSTRCTIS